ncbi:non-ribosomal peptide synthase domain TIGR01720/amino acid adenylation domain-containing protein [Chitinophaga rupis]|uniref:Non-ribosomal peptide synthase domain TIGR01720/amino acid adenylation domain-containing protein n=1 Tax=Chitinophaga rupis TaxID=573321 RepID=A0A1H8KCV7_9BACT|nr:non-ribosomal peptide synthetase [Chitinophaga rupis]SEN90842.1 non-ribosomal peptide synthase domain TIGR01720/amino acid adenylation domain-containing protein [Chitinophaga rupis]
MDKKVILYADWQSTFAKKDPSLAKPAPFCLQQCTTDPLQQKEKIHTRFPISSRAKQLLMEGTESKRKLDIFVLFMTSFGILFSRYMDTDEVLVYTPALKGKDGEPPAVQEVPVLMLINKDSYFRTQLNHTGDTIFGTYVTLNDILPVPEERLSNCLFMMDGVHDAPAGEQLQQYDVVVKINVPDNEDWSIEITYSKALFLDSFITGMEKHLHNVLYYLDALVTPVGTMNILTGEEQELLLNTYNQSFMPLPAAETVVSVFMQQAAAYAAHIALEDEGGTITYHELDEKSTQLALHLEKVMQVKKGMRVGVMLEKSASTVVALLAVMKAGAVYVPVDPTLPQGRIAYMLENAGIRQLITASSFLFKIEHFNGDVFAIDLQEPAVEEAAQLTQLPVGTDAAYIIYTSGSTGQPKGVILQHEGLLNTAWHHVQELGMLPEDNYLQFMSSSFDGSLLDIFTTLLSGATLVIPAAADINDTARFLQLLEQKQVTIFTITPSYLSALNKAPMPGVRTIISAGEPAVVEDALYYGAEKSFYNGYGPSEITVNATLYKADAAQMGNTVPIGRPSANKQIYLVDGEMRLLPPGFTGEICIGGTGLAAGYLGDEALTHQKFVASPFASGGRLYRTGDNGRWLPDGNIVFMGRRDEQLKLNGYRIDPGEITTVLRAYPGIADAKAFIGTGANLGNVLAACYVTDANNTAVVEEAALRAYLAGKLPVYMQPSLLLPVSYFPVTANGKLDKQQLIEMAVAGKILPQAEAAPLTPMEQILGDIWCEVLGCKNLTKDDDFFHLGGDSIKSIQIVSRLLKAGYKLDVKQLFDKPVLAEAALLMVPAVKMADQSEVTGEVPFMPIHQEVFLADETDQHHYNQAMMLFSEDGFDQEGVRRVFEKIMEHHDALRIVMDREEGRLRLINKDTSLKPLIRFFEPDPASDVAVFIETQAALIQTSINLEQGPLLQVAVFHTPDGDYLLLVVHHLVVDSISMRILLEDLEKLYAQWKSGQPLVLPPKTDSFKRWAEELTAYANSRLLLKERNYWAGVMQEDVVPIKRDMAGVLDNMPADAEKIGCALDQEDTAALVSSGYRVLNAEMNDILLAALMLAVKQTFGINAAYIALEGHGREEVLDNITVSRTVGWFTTTYPLLLDITTPADITDVITTVKEQRKKVPNNGIGYGVLKYLTPPESKHGYVFNQQAQIGFNYLGQFDTDIDNTSFTIPSVRMGEEQSRKRKRLHDLEVRAQVANRHLQLTVEFNKKHFRGGTIFLLASQFEANLKQVAEFCREQDTSRLSPVDLTYKNLSIDDLDSIFS